MNVMKIETKKIPLKDLHPNTGQVSGLPKNPRFVRDEKFTKLKLSLAEDPEFMEVRPIVAYDNGGELVIVGGNMRYRALKDMGVKDAHVTVLPQETPVEKLRAFTIKDNANFGDWDWNDLIEWDTSQLEDWGLDIPIHGGFFHGTQSSGKRVLLDFTPKLHVLQDSMFISMYNVVEDGDEELGISLKDFKSEKYAHLVASHLTNCVRSLGLNFPMIAPPPRRHKDYNFAEDVIKIASNTLDVKCYAQCFKSLNMDRLNPSFEKIKDVEEDFLILFDDVITTGSTLKAFRKNIKNSIIIVAACNR